MDNKLIDGIYYFENKNYLKAFEILIIYQEKCKEAQYC